MFIWFSFQFTLKRSEMAKINGSRLGTLSLFVILKSLSGVLVGALNSPMCKCFLFIGFLLLLVFFLYSSFSATVQINARLDSRVVFFLRASSFVRSPSWQLFCHWEILCVTEIILNWFEINEVQFDCLFKICVSTYLYEMYA